MVVLVVGVLPGCGRLFKATCVRPGDFAAAIDNKPLQVPAGLQGPDTRTSLPVPKLEEPERARGPEEPCLDAPPRYANPAPPRPAA